uniref:Uncharacterized protein n=1 Tax=Amphimedon queenslandica TaxID=400682 RepID=A0A1X7VJF0_AMPQE
MYMYMHVYTSSLLIVHLHWINLQLFNPLIISSCSPPKLSNYQEKDENEDS